MLGDLLALQQRNTRAHLLRERLLCVGCSRGWANKTLLQQLPLECDLALLGGCELNVLRVTHYKALRQNGLHQVVFQTVRQVAIGQTRRNAEARAQQLETLRHLLDAIPCLVLGATHPNGESIWAHFLLS